MPKAKIKGKPVITNEKGSLEELKDSQSHNLDEKQIADIKKESSVFKKQESRQNRQKSSESASRRFEQPKKFNVADKYKNKVAADSIISEETSLESVEDEVYDRYAEINNQRKERYTLKKDTAKIQEVSQAFNELNEMCETEVNFQVFITNYSKILESSRDKSEKLKTFFATSLSVFLEGIEEDTTVSKSIEVLEKLEEVMKKTTSLYTSKHSNHDYPYLPYCGNKSADLKIKLNTSIHNCPKTVYEYNESLFKGKTTSERIDLLNGKLPLIENASLEELKEICNLVSSAKDVNKNRGFRWKVFNFIKNSREKSCIKNLEKELDKRISKDERKELFLNSRDDHSIEKGYETAIDNFLKEKANYMDNISTDLAKAEKVNDKEPIIVNEVIDVVEEVSVEVQEDLDKSKDLTKESINQRL